MEVRALCVRLLIHLLMLLVTNVQQSRPQTQIPDAGFRVVPARLQVFEYGSVNFTCEGFSVSAGPRVRTVKEFLRKCSNSTSTVTCTIDFAFVSDSGEYWCEGSGGERSRTVNITVTAGPVILESPVLPVMEGDPVTLSCRTKKTSSSHLTAEFYKDGRHIRTSSTRNMTVESVSKSDEGLYKCYMSGAGESPESRLAVRGGDVILESPVLPVMEGEAVTLRCRTKKPHVHLKAGFYKDDLLIRNSSTGEMTISSVSKSDEGLYKCRISGAGVSAQSRLTVKEERYSSSVNQSEDANTQHADRTESDKWIHIKGYYSILLWISVGVILFLQLLVIGLLYWKKKLVLLEAKMFEPNLCPVIRKNKKKKKKDAADAADILSLESNQSTKPQTEKDTDEPLPESFCSTFQ